MKVEVDERTIRDGEDHSPAMQNYLGAE